MLAMLERQRAFFAGAEHVRREVEIWRDATPVERLCALAEMCAGGEYFVSRMAPEIQAQLATPTPLPEDTIRILQALRGSQR